MDITEERSYYAQGYDACLDREESGMAGALFDQHLCRLRSEGATVQDAQEFVEGWRHAAVDGFCQSVAKRLKAAPDGKAFLVMRLIIIVEALAGLTCRRN